MVLTSNPAYQKFKSEFDENAKLDNFLKLTELFKNDSERFEKYHVKLNTPDGDILFDYSKNLINDDYLKKLIEIVCCFNFKTY